MSDPTTLNHIARVLTSVSPQMPADAALRRYFYQHTYLSPHLRRSVSRGVFVYFRWKRWLNAEASSQTQAEHALFLHERFQQDSKSVKPEALAARAVPDWLKLELDLPTDYLRQLQREPALWLRARPGKAHKLAAALGHCQFTERAPDALHYTGEKDLFRTAQFHEGEFEIQDLASQLVGVAAAPSAGQTWWDACAGEGGKTLHLADLMQNKGLIWVTDRSEKRLQTFKKRSTRAKLYNHRSALWDGTDRLPTKAKFDGILVDAPCSGVGTWQRNPHARWTTTIDDVRELAVTQLNLLNHVAGSLKPGGRLIYAVCTLTRTETAGVAEAFSAAHPELTPAPIAALGSAMPSTMLWPHELNANGMYIAMWQRT
ncbi:MAG: RsmB/NOP family class I SAM-dependent RNA methyltransferase [Cephaloticoccus sp.]|nr:RsmB/NOP family class I SAM-dependent RNA methyltransferase [Cephaloticoccus sp.]MCF7759967.1 RsmB/NOP family class I SAM-dependent RNA methyltransferase [Cephaloticoccus sp.]